MGLEVAWRREQLAQVERKESLVTLEGPQGQRQISPCDFNPLVCRNNCPKASPGICTLPYSIPSPAPPYQLNAGTPGLWSIPQVFGICLPSLELIHQL